MAYKIADGYIEIHGRRDREQIARESAVAGREGGEIAGREGGRAASNASRREARRNRDGFFSSLFTPDPGLFRVLMLPLSTPIALIGAMLGGAFIAGWAGALLAAGIPTLLGLLFVGVGAAVLANNKRIIAGFEDMKTKVVLTLERAAQPLIGPFLRAMDMIEGSFARMEPTLKRIFTAIAPVIAPLTAGVMGFLEEFVTAIEPVMPDIVDIMISLAAQLPALGRAVGEFFKMFADNKELIQFVIPAAIGALGVAIKGIGVIILFAAGYFGQWIEIYRFLQDLFTNKIPSVWNAFVAWLSGIWDGIKDAWSGLTETVENLFMVTIPGVWDRFTSWISGRWSNFTEWASRTWAGIWEPIVTFTAALPGRISAFFDELPDRLRSAALRAFDGLFYAIGFGIGTVLAFFRDLPGRVIALVDSMWETVKARTTAAVEAVVTYVSALPGRVSAWFEGMRARATERTTSMWETVKARTAAAVEAVVTYVSALPGQVGAWLASMRDRITATVASAWESARARTVAGINSVVAWVSGLPGRARSAISGIGNTLFGAGRDLINGMINGVKSAVAGLVSAVKRAMNQAVQGAKDALGIASPSKVFEVEVGRQVVAGAERGVAAGASPLRDRIGGLFGGLPSALPQQAPVAAAGGGAVTIGNLSVHFPGFTGTLDRATADRIAGTLFDAIEDYRKGYR